MTMRFSLLLFFRRLILILIVVFSALFSSLFLSSLISNSEAWVNLTEKNLNDLEAVDEQLLRDILSAHPKTAKELLYLETGSLPVRYVIMSRRLNFLHYILCEEEDTLLRRFLDMFSKNIEELKKITKILLNKFTSFSIQVNRLPTKKSSSAAKVSNLNDNIITLVDLE